MRLERRNPARIGRQVKAALATGLALALSGTAALAGPTLVEKDTLSVGSDLTYPPFAYLQDGRPSGFDVELMEGIAERMHLAAAFVDTRFVSLVPGLRANRFDAIASALYVTPERQRVVDFIPYLKAGSSLLVLRDADYRPATEQELCGKIVGSMQGASWLPKLESLSNEYCVPNGLGAIETREFDTDAQVTQALRAGAVDVEFMDNVVAAELLQRFPDDYAVTSTSLIYPVLVGIAVHPRNKALLSAIDDAFTELREDGTYAALVEKYGMQPVSDAEIADVLSAAN